MKKEYSTLEVIQMLVNNNNTIMQLVNETKYFTIEGEEVVSYRKRWVVEDEEINRYTFESIIKKAQQR